MSDIPPLVKARDSDRAYTILKQQIITLVIEPGASISEMALQQSLGFGRTPIREALLRLAQEGLVTILPRKGMTASEIRIVEIHEVFELRLYLEGLAARLAAERFVPEDAQRLEEILQAAKQSSGAPLFDVEIDIQFHTAIAEIARNGQLTAMLDRLRTISLRLQYLVKTRMASAQDELPDYYRIVTAIREHRPDQAEALMRAHVTAAKQRALAYF